MSSHPLLSDSGATEDAVPETLRARKSLLHWVFGAFGGGAGMSLGYAAIEAIRARPEFLPQLLSSGALGFVALIAFMWMFRQQLSIFIRMQERHVVAQEKLAVNVGLLVARDDLRAREQDILLNHLAKGNEEILRRLNELPCVQAKQCVAKND